MAALDDTVGAYEMYLDSYPAGKFAAAASDRIAVLERARKDARREAMARQDAEAAPVSFTSAWFWATITSAAKPSLTC